MKWKDSFHPYAIITIVFWSLAYVLTRLTLQHFSPFSSGFLRYLTASITLLAVVLFARMRLPRREDIKWFLASGGFGFFLYMVTFNTGCETVSAATGSVVLATVPVLTALLARLFYGERLMRYQWAAIAIEFLGVLLLTLMNDVFSANRGLVWLFFAAIALSAYNLLQRRLTRTYTALQTSTYSIFAGTAMLAVFAPTALREAADAPPVQFLYIGILGVFSSAIAYLAWSRAFAKAKQTSSVSNYMFLTPFLTTLMAFLIAGEVPDGSTLAGGAVLLCGVFIFNFGGSLFKKREAAKEQP